LDGATTVSGNGLLSGQTVNLADLSLGTHTFSVDAEDNVNNASTASVAFSVTSPLVTLSVTSLSFGSQLVNTSSTWQSVTLRNTGNSTLELATIGASQGFFERNNCGLSVEASTSCDIDVAFTPETGGTQTGTLIIMDGAPGAPGGVHTVALSGTGQDFSVGVASGGSTSATVSPGESATYDLSFLPIGGFKGTVSLAFQGEILQATCVVSPASLTPK